MFIHECCYLRSRVNMKNPVFCFRNVRYLLRNFTNIRNKLRTFPCNFQCIFSDWVHQNYCHSSIESKWSFRMMYKNHNNASFANIFLFIWITSLIWRLANILKKEVNIWYKYKVSRICTQAILWIWIMSINETVQQNIFHYHQWG